MIISIGIRDLCQGLLLFLAFFLFLFFYFYVVRYRADVAFRQARARTEAKEREETGAQDIFSSSFGVGNGEELPPLDFLQMRLVFWLGPYE